MEKGRVQGLATADLQGEDRSGLLKCSFNTPSCHPVGCPGWGKVLCWASKRQVSHGRAALKVLPSLFTLQQTSPRFISLATSNDREMSLAKNLPKY